MRFRRFPVCDEVPSTVRTDTVTDGGTRGGLQACQTDRRDSPRKCGSGGERQGSLRGTYTTKRLRRGARGTARDSAVVRGWLRMGTVQYQGARAVEGGWPDRSQRSRLDWPLRLGTDGLITGGRMSFYLMLARAPPLLGLPQADEPAGSSMRRYQLPQIKQVSKHRGHASYGAEVPWRERSDLAPSPASGSLILTLPKRKRFKSLDNARDDGSLLFLAKDGRARVPGFRSNTQQRAPKERARRSLCVAAFCLRLLLWSLQGEHPLREGGPRNNRRGAGDMCLVRYRGEHHASDSVLLGWVAGRDRLC